MRLFIYIHFITRCYHQLHVVLKSSFLRISNAIFYVFLFFFNDIELKFEQFSKWNI